MKSIFYNFQLISTCGILRFIETEHLRISKGALPGLAHKALLLLQWS